MAADPDRRTFPATSGTFTGWVGIVACAVLLVGLLVHEQDLVAVRWSVALVLVALLIYAFMLRPAVQITPGVLLLRNPLEDIAVPMGRLTGFEVRSATMAFVGKKRYVGVGVGKPVRVMVRGQSEAAPGRPDGLGRLGEMSGGRSGSIGGLRSGMSGASSGRNLTVELLEDAVRAGRSDAEARRDFDGEVVRRPVWWLIGAVGALAVVLAVTFLF